VSGIDGVFGKAPYRLQYKQALRTHPKPPPTGHPTSPSRDRLERGIPGMGQGPCTTHMRQAVRSHRST